MGLPIIVVIFIAIIVFIGLIILSQYIIEDEKVRKMAKIQGSISICSLIAYGIFYQNQDKIKTS